MPNNTTTDPMTDQEVFENLYKQRRDRLLASITGMVRDRDRAEDITAAAFQSAWEKREQFRGDSSLGTWLYAIGLNAARGSGRQERTVLHDPLDRLETQRYAEPDRLFAGLEQDELRALVWKALDRIPHKSRRLLIDRYIDGRSVEEITRREHVPTGTVGGRLFTAKALLRQAWQSTTRPRLAGDIREEKVRQIAEEALNRLAAALEAGYSEPLKEYLAAQARFRHYSWHNVMLITAQRPTATRVAGYHTWNDLGRHVKPGEKGIMIFAPILTKQKESPERTQSPEDTATNKPDPFRLTRFRTAFVFDVQQTEGKPLPVPARTAGDLKELAEKLKSFATEQGFALEYVQSIAPAQGVSHGGKIRLLPDMHPPAEFSVLTRELALEMFHQKAGTSRLPFEIEYAQAKAVAYAVCQRIGLQPNPAPVIDTNLYDGGKRALAESLSTIHDASSRILDELLPPERPSPFHERQAEQEIPFGSPPTQEAPERASVASSAPPMPDQAISFDR